jgi:hypothetical protein
VDLVDELSVVSGLDEHDHGFDVAENTSAVITEALEIVHPHRREVLDLASPLGKICFYLAPVLGKMFQDLQSLKARMSKVLQYWTGIHREELE